MLRHCIFLFGLLLLLSGCKGTEQPSPEGVVEGVGTIRFVELEGGFYGLVAEDGTQYNPLDLDAQYRQDGLRVRFRVRPREDVFTIQMWGTPVDVLEIEAVGR